MRHRKQYQRNEVDDAEMPERRNMIGHHKTADHTTGEAGEAPQTVERSHDAAAVNPFHTYPLCVYADVAEVPAHPENEQSQRKLPYLRYRAQRHQHSRIQHCRGGQCFFAAETTHQVAGKPHGGELSQWECEQYATQSRVGKMECVFNIGDTTGPGGKNESLQKEERAYANPEIALCGERKRKIHAATVFCAKKWQQFVAAKLAKNH